VIYSDSASNVEASYSSSPAVFEVLNAVTTTNMSTTLLIPSLFYYQYTFSGIPVFHCQWLTGSSSNSISGNGISSSSSPTFQLSPPLQFDDLGLIMAGIAIALFILRLIFFDKKMRAWCSVDLLSALFMVLALFFMVFTPVGLQRIQATVSNVPACSGGTCITQTVSLNGIVTTQTAQIPPNSTSFILLIAFVSAWVLIQFLLMVYDFYAARHQDAEGIP
jgi:hypothetical protein